jgi:predicted nucleic acid-binding protein
VEAALGDGIELILTDTLVAEARAVLVDPAFRGHLPGPLADALLDALQAAASVVIADVGAVAPHRCGDPDDDYLVDAALAEQAMLVSRDDRADFKSVEGLDSGRPGTALRRAGLLDD